MTPIIWTKAATTDIERHYSFLEPIDPGIAKKAVQAILKAGESLTENPRRGAVVLQAKGLRKLRVPFGKFGFVIHYIFIETEVLILRIYHGRENRQT
ncbi:MAG: type II toxin-antitoxin system RelE/ParE family toxin [Acaryochloridaceae cyanobacterium RU_4_10]|nr:type II toxin-antitoxin system RelE/ParE family toxin [Acaryochloridaceae cyanobacterium RU_4_10]